MVMKSALYGGRAEGLLFYFRDATSSLPSETLSFFRWIDHLAVVSLQIPPEMEASKEVAKEGDVNPFIHTLRGGGGLGT